MNISGILIMIDVKKKTHVLEALKMFEGLELHKVYDDGKIVAVMERETTNEEVSAVKELNLMDGILSAVMVYHNFEDEVERITAQQMMEDPSTGSV